MSAFKGSLSELLNPAPSPSRPRQSPPEPSPPPHGLKSPTQGSVSWPGGSPFATSTPVTSTYEAANTLTAHATTTPSSSYTHAFAPPPSSHSMSREPYSPVDSYGHARRTSTFGSVAGPIEPPPSTDRLPQPPHSPTTLDQYHHGSKSPEEQQRRQSVFSAPADAPRLAPIQSLTQALGEKMSDQPPRENVFGHSSLLHEVNSAHQTMAADHDRPLNTVAESGETNTVDNTPVTEQIREASPAKMNPYQRTELSPSAKIKSEDSPAPVAQMGMPTDGSQGTPPQEDMDPETKKLVQKLQNEHGVRGGRAKPSIETIPAFEPPQLLSKKRAPPKSSVAAAKKGTAKKPPPKKRRVDTVDSGSPTSAATRGSPTPSRQKGSKTCTPALESSPAVESQVGDDFEDEAASAASGDDVYCICRKGDDHSWMIACDGGCEDWFHGKCVNIREEDGDLIDRYICPNCAKKSGATTTWKPMCRRDGCRKPARVAKSNVSKYCSEYCGELFMSRCLERAMAPADPSKKKSPKSRRKSMLTDNFSNAGDDSEDEDLGPRGSTLRPGEVKTLAKSAKNVDSFRSLGDGVLSPPPTASPSVERFPNGSLDSVELEKLPPSYTLQPSETERISAIADEKDVLRKRRQLLKEKDKFYHLVRDQVTRWADRENIKVKDVCGYDRRLGWGETQFEQWRNSATGRKAFGLATLDPAEIEEANGEIPAGKEGPTINGDVEMADGDDEKSNDKDYFCAKKRCQRHHGWQKLALHDARNAETELADEMRALDREEREIRERAMLRWRKETGTKGVDGTLQVAG